MFLKRLELQGFKSFATRTEFEFNGGITAIVGPNGVGKSNIADGLRWVLGEQSGRLLRTRRLEDVIFSGSSRRSPTAMAEVSVVFDNSSGNFPLEFTEVAITRRAYRSGESEYYINGRRTRLREVVDLLLKGKLGRDTYTIMGQGLVDIALSQRPEERRSLLEDAADVRRHRLKLTEAQQKLAATQRNLERLNYVLNEIGPRLSRLEGQVKRARERERLAQELSAKLQQWYQMLARDSQRLLDATQRRCLEAEQALEEGREQVAAQERGLAELRLRRREGRQGLEERLRRREELRAREQELSRSLAVDGQRLSLLSQQREELREEAAALEVQWRQQSEEGGRAQERWLELEEEMKGRAGELASWERHLERLERRYQDLETSLSRHRDQSLEQATRLANLRSRLEQLEERRAELAAESESWRGRQQALTAERAEQEQLLGEVVSRSHRLALEAEDLERERRQLLRRWAEAHQAMEQHQVVLQRAQQEADKLKVRLELVAQLRSQGEGLSAGTKAVLEAAMDSDENAISPLPAAKAAGGGPTPSPRRLRGVLGTLASIIEVPSGLEAAIEAALEGQLQDIVVRSWKDAEAAVSFLKENEAGRANFFPLDSLREVRPLQLVAERGVVGVASKLVRCAPGYQKLVDTLLGRVIVVDNLEVARRVISRGLGSVVTRSGELLRPIGSLSGGSRSLGSALVEWEREWRELPSLGDELEAEVAALTARLATEAERCRHYEGALGALEERASRLEGQRQALVAEERGHRRRLEGIDQELAWRGSLAERMEREGEALQRRRQALVAEEGEVVAASAALQRSIQSLEEQARSLEEERSTVRKQLEGARTDLALVEGERNNRRSLWASFEANLKNLQSQMEARTLRARQLEEEGQGLSARLSSARSEHEALLVQLAALEGELSPLRQGLAQLEEEEARLVQRAGELRPRLQRLEEALRQAQAEAAQAQEGWIRLCSTMEAEGIVLPEEASPAEPLPDAQALKRQIERLRAQLGGLGPVDAETSKEYEQTRSRYQFLASQMKDLQETERSLRGAIAELEEVIKEQFLTTFNRVGDEFSRYFTTFFGGGSAKLVLTQPNNPAESGIEIIARPPGRRLQSLALLSGGERALTGTALLFALLQANPAPFCVLDEVDAALDDANIVRFSQALKGLAEQTQFIIITHNRGTMEIADTLYGVSMSEDSTSRVLSLRLNGADQLPQGD